MNLKAAASGRSARRARSLLWRGRGAAVQPRTYSAVRAVSRSGIAKLRLADFEPSDHFENLQRLPAIMVLAGTESAAE